jgi:anaerobic magnesium-protoporphyrin IX monomethyl ester cyclase
MKILLLQPSSIENKTIGPPLGLGYLASNLFNKGYTVKIIDPIIQKCNQDDLKKEIKLYDPDVVGITSISQYIFDIFDIFNFTKFNNSSCFTVLGGPHASALALETLKKCKDIDFIVRGEGEITFTELLENTKNEKYSSVKGITYRFNKRIYENTDRPLLKNLDTLPFPAYQLFQMNKYKINDRWFDIGVIGRLKEQYCTLVTSRGCPYGCVFCVNNCIWGKYWRGRAPSNIIEELKILRYKYNKKIIDIMDPIFTFNKERTIQICKLIREEKLDISWISTTRVDYFDREIAQELKKSGCNFVYFGIESGVQKTLDYINKGVTPQMAVDAVKTAKNAGLKVGGSFVIGIPCETIEMIKNTIDFAKKLRLNTARFPVLVPYPGTEMYTLAQKQNLIKNNNFSTYNYSMSVLKNNNFSSRELKGLQLKAILKNSLQVHIFIQLMKGLIPSQS